MLIKPATLVIATKNEGKLKEMAPLLSDLPFAVQSLLDFPQIKTLPETGKTFKENAIIKARAVYRVTGHYVLADDSGLECEDLKGAPGVLSARFAGDNATDEANNKKLIEELSQIDDPSRLARYVCALVLIDPMGHESVVEETCGGMITMTPGGNGGFGYDPYFFLPEIKCTMAELPLSEKNKISHRGKALLKMYGILKTRLAL